MSGKEEYLTAKWFVQQVSEIEELAEAILTDKEQVEFFDF